MIANPMTAREPFDVFYSKKLMQLKIELQEVIKGDIPYPVSEIYKCVKCEGRIFLHTMEGQILCLLCQVPTIWPQELKTRVGIILESYPSLEASQCDWQALQSVTPPSKTRSRAKVKAGGDVELGKQIKEARLKLGLSKRELGSKIFKQDGRNRLSGKSIEGYENGYVMPPEKVLVQIRQVLKLEGWQTWDDIERDLKGQSDG